MKLEKMFFYGPEISRKNVLKIKKDEDNPKNTLVTRLKQ